MPSRMPPLVVLTGLFHTAMRLARRFGRLALVAGSWLVLVPLTVTYMWSVLFPSSQPWRLELA